MSGFGEREFETAQLRADQERLAGVAALQSAQALPGTDVCVDCDEPIDPARRQAQPHARRCLPCQTDFEKA